MNEHSWSWLRLIGWCSILLATAFDIATTRIAIDVYGLRESNPFMQPLVYQYPLLDVCFQACIILVIFCSTELLASMIRFHWLRGWAYGLMVLFGTQRGMTVYHNLQMIQLAAEYLAQAR